VFAFSFFKRRRLNERDGPHNTDTHTHTQCGPHTSRPLMTHVKAFIVMNIGMNIVTNIVTTLA